MFLDILGNNLKEVNEMKIVVKRVSTMLIVGLIVTIVVYPILHELGHSIVAILFGAEVLEFNIFPYPNVLCNIKSVSSTGIIAISIAGCAFPILFAVKSPSKFIGWYTCFTIRWVCVLSYLISIVSVILFQLGMPVQNEDITHALIEKPQYVFAYLIFYLILMIVSVLLIVKSNPMEHLVAQVIEKTKSECSH